MSRGCWVTIITVMVFDDDNNNDEDDGDGGDDGGAGGDAGNAIFYVSTGRKRMNFDEQCLKEFRGNNI